MSSATARDSRDGGRLVVSINVLVERTGVSLLTVCPFDLVADATKEKDGRQTRPATQQSEGKFNSASTTTTTLLFNQQLAEYQLQRATPTRTAYLLLFAVQTTVAVQFSIRSKASTTWRPSVMMTSPLVLYTSDVVFVCILHWHVPAAQQQTDLSHPQLQSKYTSLYHRLSLSLLIILLMCV